MKTKHSFLIYISIVLECCSIYMQMFITQALTQAAKFKL
jgi:hypothetical protein